MFIIFYSCLNDIFFVWYVFIFLESVFFLKLLFIYICVVKFFLYYIVVFGEVKVKISVIILSLLSVRKKYFFIDGREFEVGGRLRFIINFRS